ncbi:class I SAM-dependent methyltransferase [Streptosporangium sp. NBC_01756]|uniref:class I SAM-dependent methyltransferase n=1 Tax=Streptosporangium sp. NBC_01756 TaxID=2975950 RepID=UPI002DD8DE6A|nr:class I SAM-dependent methyltransferase [Streptosporangium sp. NBC_01756]WSC83910.1 methyltransferase domain-containing protein [Streptosporangium sp. NBC_01756]
MEVADSRLRRRELFDTDADGYGSSRPGYPTQVYELLEHTGALRPGARVLEIGAGSGQATRELLGRGTSVCAVELGANFAARLRSEFRDQALTVIEGDFDSLTNIEVDFDLAVCASSLHWLDRGTTLQKIGQLLRPAGWIAAWWTVYGDPERPTPFRAALNAVLRQHHPAGELGVAGPFDHKSWIGALEAASFGGIQVKALRWSITMPARHLTGLYTTFAAVRELPESARDALLRDIETAARAHGDMVTEHCITIVYLAQKDPIP